LESSIPIGDLLLLPVVTIAAAFTRNFFFLLFSSLVFLSRLLSHGEIETNVECLFGKVKEGGAIMEPFLTPNDLRKPSASIGGPVYSHLSSSKLKVRGGSDHCTVESFSFRENPRKGQRMAFFTTSLVVFKFYGVQVDEQ